MDFSAVSTVIKTIGGPVIQEVTSLWGLKDQVASLERELKWMQSFLEDADATKVADSKVIHNYVAEVRELAYDAEDVLETFALKVAPNKKGGIPSLVKRSACCLKEGWLRYKTKSEIGRITTRITELTRLLQTYDVKRLRDEGAPSSSSTDQRRELRRPYPHIIEDNIVGLDADIRNVVSILVDEEHHDRRVVSICGMGGLGKTTLAKRVYNHSQIRRHFDHLAWVYVSQQYQKRKVWEVILDGLKFLDEEDRKKTDEDLADKLYGILKDKKCLVILDDIWKIEAWKDFESAFPTRDTSSKILLTSRNKEIVSHADRRGYLYELKLLEESESWELFQKVAFPQSDSATGKTTRVDSCMEDLGKGMIKHCAGLPLAIVVLGGILATKCSLNEWKKVSENVLPYLKKGDKLGEGIGHVLDLSYEDLPPYLRPCFLYLSQFPEDYEIQKDRLIQLWIAEGFVSIKHEEENGGETLEDVAEGYLIELMGRCMIQVEKRDVMGRIKTCRMHDVIREACLSKAKQENFVHIVGHPVADLLRIGKVPRVSVHEDVSVQCIKDPHLRSLIFFKVTSFDVEEDFEGPMIWMLVLFLCVVLPKIRATWTYVLNNFKLLRVLDFEGEDNFGGCKLPDDFGNLIHLRLLSIRNFFFVFSTLPSCLGNLRCLQTLDLRGLQLSGFNMFEDSIHVPNVIWKLRELRHLYLPEDFKRKKSRLRLNTLVNLQTLVNFNLKYCYVAHLLSLINLRELKIVWMEGAFEEHLKKNPQGQIINSKNLRSLSLEDHSGFFSGVMDPTHLMQFFSNCVSIYELSIRWVGLSKLPQHHHFPSDMAYVSLEGTLLEEDPMPTLEKLPNLRILKFGADAFTGKKMVCSAQGFPKLDSLSLDGLSLEEWEMDGGAMLALRHLEISDSRQLKMLPQGLR